jgi:hypothetical protein
MSLLPEARYIYPLESNGPIEVLQPIITIDWSVDMETTQFSNDASRALNILLLDLSTGQPVATTFVAYTASNRRLEIKPTNPLNPASQYRVLVKDKLLSSDGRRSFNTIDWTFTIAAATIGAPTPLSPPNATIQRTAPTFSWSAASYTGSGTLSYLLQVDTSVAFNTPIYSNITSDTSATLDVSLTDGTSYYWRVNARTATVTGSWSPIWSFLYDIEPVADKTSRQYYSNNNSFEVLSTAFKNGASNLRNHPSLVFTFNSPVSTGYSSFVTVTEKSVLPRNDIESSYDENTVAGTWSTSGNTLTFTPSQAIKNNTRYEITLDSSLVSSDGYTLGREEKFYWTGRYTPYYVSIRAIRARFLSAEQHIPDDLINMYIYQASLEANARYYNYLEDPYYSSIGDMPSESTVRDSQNLTSHAVLKWVEATATYKLLRAILFENVRDIGRTERLGDGLVSLSADFIKGMTAAMKEAKDEIQEWANLLTPTDIPVFSAMSANWSELNLAYDKSIPVEGRRTQRGNEF